jgi:hypothetical protein
MTTGVIADTTVVFPGTASYLHDSFSEYDDRSNIPATLTGLGYRQAPRLTRLGRSRVQDELTF